MRIRQVESQEPMLSHNHVKTAPVRSEPGLPIRSGVKSIDMETHPILSHIIDIDVFPPF